MLSRSCAFALILLSALVARAAAPANDNFASRIIVPTNAYVSVTGTTIGATKETGEKVHSPDGTPNTSTIWYQWRCPTAGSYIITTAGSDFDTVLAVYQGVASLAGMSKLDSDDNGVSPVYGTVATSLLATNFNANQNYYIAIDGWGGDSGNVTLIIRPNNDNIANRVILSGARVSTNGWNGRATAEGNEDNLGAFITQSIVGRSVWWEWTPPTTGEYLVSTIGSDFDTVLFIATNTSATVTNIKRPGTVLPDPDYDSGSFATLASLTAVSARAGQIYYIMVDGQAPDGVEDGEFNDTGQIQLSIYPNNDRFTNRVVLTGTNVSDVSANGRALFESGVGLNEMQLMQTAVASDPSITLNTKTVWWSWVAPTNGRALITTLGSDFDTVVAVYAGTNLASTENTNWHLIGWDNNGGELFDSAVDVGVLPGVAYQIQVMGNWDGATVDDGYGQVKINLSFTKGPTNDVFSTRAPLTGTAVTTTGTTINSTKEFGEPAHGAQAGGKSVWWTWTAPISGLVFVSTEGSDFDTVLGVYRGTLVSNLTLVATNDDQGDGISTSLVTFSATAGTVYQIAVDGSDDAGDPESGQVVLSIEEVVAPANDSFTNAIVLTGGAVDTTGTSVNSSKEPGEPNHAGEAGGSSVWWRWTAPFAGPAVISTSGSSFDTVLGVYTGTTVSNLTLVGANNDQDSTNGIITSAVAFNAVSNTVYRIAVDGIDASAGAISLHVAISVPSVIARPVIQPNGNISLSFSTITSRTYEIQYADDLPNWNPLQTVTAVSGTTVFTDTSNSGVPRRFYRVVEQ